MNTSEYALNVAKYSTAQNIANALIALAQRKGQLERPSALKTPLKIIGIPPKNLCSIFP